MSEQDETLAELFDEDIPVTVSVCGTSSGDEG